MAYTVFIRGIPENKQVKDVRVHIAPGLNTDAPFRIAVGAQASCTEVKPDPDNGSFQGQVYRWFHLKFDDGRDGWVRDDLLDLQGDCSPFGYGTYAMQVYAFTASAALAQPAAVPVATVPSTQPSQPVITPITVPPTQPAQPASTTLPTIPTTPVATGCDANVRADIRAKIRSGPSVLTAQIGSVLPGGAVHILGVEKGQDGQSYRWMHVTANGVDGYIREDLLNYSADCVAQGLSAGGPQPATAPTPPSTTLNPQTLYAAPLRQTYTIFREFGVNGHKGIDLDTDVGTPVVASGNGVVAFTMRCTKCTDAAPNFGSQGVAFWNPRAINDPAWGYGFGNHVVVRYAWADLPGSMRDAMTAQNLAGGYAYVIHGHLSRIMTTQDTAVQDGTVLGLSGNTGNSTGPHLHLEVRVSLSPNETTIFNRLVLNPRVMYRI